MRQPRSVWVSWCGKANRAGPDLERERTREMRWRASTGLLTGCKLRLGFRSWGKGGIPLTPVAPTGSSPGYGGLSSDASGARVPLRLGGSVPRLPRATPVAARFVCPTCEGTQAWCTGRGLWMCGSCGHQTSVTAGTLFQDTRTSLVTWFRPVWWVVSQKNGASALGLQRVLGLGSYRTAWT